MKKDKPEDETVTALSDVRPPSPWELVADDKDEDGGLRIISRLPVERGHLYLVESKQHGGAWTMALAYVRA